MSDKSIGNMWGTERVKIAGREFYRVPRAEWNKRMKELFPGKEHLYADNDSPAVLFPYYPFDDRLEFPAQSTTEDVGFLIKAGIVSHSVDFSDRPSALGGFPATKLMLFAEDDWYGECFSVLTAHGWMVNGNIPSELIERLESVEGEGIYERVKDQLSSGFETGDDSWEVYLYELAATHFSPPLSRLWYAANMLSLFYVHHDDMRTGYLWCEYHMRMRYELFALKHIEMTEKNRESGMKGGQAEKKRERYQILDRLAGQKFKVMAFASDREFIRIAKSMAADYDSKADSPLFTVGGKSLSKKWYDEWASHFRSVARGTE